MPSPIELALNGIVNQKHEHHAQIHEVAAESVSVHAIASSIMDTYGKDASRGLMDDEGEWKPKRQTDGVVIHIPYTDRPNTNGQDVYMFLSDSTEAGKHSGSVLELSVPTLFDVTTLFYFRKDPVHSFLPPTITRHDKASAEMSDLVIARQLLQHLSIELGKKASADAKS